MNHDGYDLSLTAVTMEMVNPIWCYDGQVSLPKIGMHCESRWKRLCGVCVYDLMESPALLSRDT